MNEPNDTAKKEMPKDTLKVANPGRLQLTKTVESGKVKQNFTHGRSKSVTVEVRKTRTYAQGASGGMVEVKAQPGGPTGSTPPAIEQAMDDESIRHLTQDERQSRLRALKVAEEEMRRHSERQSTKQEAEKAFNDATTKESAAPAAARSDI